MKFEDVLGKQVLVLDGAMGTMVQNLELDDAAFGGAAFKMLTDLLIFSRPDDLEGIHLEYLQAGANLIETDTFGASPLRLKEFDFSLVLVIILSSLMVLRYISGELGDDSGAMRLFGGIFLMFALFVFD